MKTIIIANVFDPESKLLRAITSDSPAGFNKVFSMATALAGKGFDAEVFSYGFGRSTSSELFLRSFDQRFSGVTIHYVSSLNVRIVANIYAAFSMFFYVISRIREIENIVIYNYTFYHFFSVTIAKLFKKQIVVDIEDAPDLRSISLLEKVRICLLKYYLCLSEQKIFTISSRIAAEYSLDNKYAIIYGVDSFNKPAIDKNWNDKLCILYSGSIMNETGLLLFEQAVKIIGSQRDDLVTNIEFVITGFGAASRIKKLSDRYVFVKYYGRVDVADYNLILSKSHITLSLKIPGTHIGDSTFPSKVVEYALSSTLLVSTRVSDVPRLFGDEILYVDTAEDIVKHIDWIVKNRVDAKRKSMQLFKKAKNIFSITNVGNKLVEVLVNKRDIKRLVFWQNIISPHQIYLINEMTRYYKVTLVVEKTHRKERVNMGWSIPVVDSCIDVIVTGDDDKHYLQKILDNAEYFHIFSGFNACHGISRYFNYLYQNRPDSCVVMMENPMGVPGIKSRLRHLLYRYYSVKYRNVAFILANGASEYLIKNGFNKHKVYPYAYFSRIDNLTIEKQEKTSADVNFIFVGSLIRRKNVSLIIEAFSRIKAKNWRLTIIGDGPEQKQLKKKASLMIHYKKIEFLEFMDNNSVLKKISAGDCLLLSSLHDGWGYTVNEALKCGCRIICSDACGVSTVLRNKKYATVFKSDSVEELEAAIGNIIKGGPLVEHERQEIIESSNFLDVDCGARYLKSIIDYQMKVKPLLPIVPWQNVDNS